MCQQSHVRQPIRKLSSQSWNNIWYRISLFVSFIMHMQTFWSILTFVYGDTRGIIFYITAVARRMCIGRFSYNIYYCGNNYSYASFIIVWRRILLSYIGQESKCRKSITNMKVAISFRQFLRLRENIKFWIVVKFCIHCQSQYAVTNNIWIWIFPKRWTHAIHCMYNLLIIRPCIIFKCKWCNNS